MNKTILKPLPGKALVQLQGFFTNAGTIIIPDIATVRTKCEAKLICYGGLTTRPDLEAAMKADACIILKPYAGTQTFSWEDHDDLCIVLIEDIEAWSPVPLNVKQSEHADGAAPRCHYCGPAIASKSSNAMLLVDGPTGYYCPRCYRDKAGFTVDPDAVTLSEDESRMMTL
jgi:hypothetical protein